MLDKHYSTLHRAEVIPIPETSDAYSSFQEKPTMSDKKSLQHQTHHAPAGGEDQLNSRLNRRQLLHMGLGLPMVLAATPEISAEVQQDIPKKTIRLRKTVIEYSLPAAHETHELVAVNDQRMMLISQQTNSTLLKIVLDSNTGMAQSTYGCVVGQNEKSGLHGLRNSKAYPGMVWCAVQFDSTLVLIDPVVSDVSAPVKVKQTIPIPSPGRGPHVVIEEGDYLWVTLKDSHHVLRINHRDPSDYRLYKSSRNPIFVAKHSNLGLLYTSQDQSSKILCINPITHATHEIDIPEAMGNTPVGLIAGPDGNVWFVLLGNSQGGTGTFGRIVNNNRQDSDIQWFHLKNSLGKSAALIHLAFEDSDAHGERPRLWLLSSSIVAPSAIDSLIEVRFDPDYKAIDTIATSVFPTQLNKAHRVLPLQHGIYATELATSVLTHLVSNPAEDTTLYDETSDYYATFGLGVKASAVKSYGS
ncbi:hypothetical protein Lepto7375DRAFT_1133 [Leptolyngbya sp. PCC 7375]|nr:hypothetical protein Lepto7375DRAFT_1133 [Leptolyngbya sp. PCC 7375]